MGLDRVRNAQAGRNLASLVEHDLEWLRRLHERWGLGRCIEYVDHSIAVLSPAGEVVARGTHSAMEQWLRVRLTRAMQRGVAA